MADFDPLYYWLGIPPGEQPPDHYRLLGIRRFENDPLVIENAADRQMVHLKTFQTGPHSDDSQRLLNRVASARICLLNPGSKSAYDDKLSRDEAELAAAASLAREQADSLPHDSDAHQEAALQSIAEIDRTAGRRLRKKNRLFAAVSLIVAIGAIVVIAGIFASNRPVAVTPDAKTLADKQPVAHDAVRQIVTPDAAAQDAAATDAHARADKQPLAHDPVAPEVAKSDAEIRADKPPAAPEVDEQTVAPAPQSANRSRDELTFEGNSESNDVRGEKPQPKSDATEQAAEKKPDDEKPLAKRPLPSAAEQKKFVGLMEEAYNFSALKTPLDRTALAEKLVGDALKAKSNGGEQFVLLNRAAELASAGGDPAAMFRAVDAIGERYQFDPSALKLRLLKGCLNETGNLEGVAAFWTACESQINAYLNKQRYDEALDTAKTVCQVIQSLQNKTLRMQSLAWKKALAQVNKDYQEFRQAEKKLASEPRDPAANLTVGRWLCFQRDDYKAGLPFLAKGGDAELAALARREIDSPPITAGDKAALADAWWDLGEKAKSEQRVCLCLHAADLYREALPELSGLAKATAQKRLEAVVGLMQFTQPQNRLACLVSQSNWQLNKKRHPIKWAVCALCDDDFIMCVNGKEVLKGNLYQGPSKAILEMAAGDIITVRAVNTGGGPRDFCCAMRSEKGPIIVTGPAWRRYLPLEANTWAEPGGIFETAQSLPGNNGSISEKVQQETGIKAQVIWGTEDTCYLTTQVP